MRLLFFFVLLCVVAQSVLHPNWEDFSVTVLYDMNGLTSTHVVWNAFSLSKGSEDWKYWTDIKFNKKYATKDGYEYRIEDGLCGIKHSTFAPVNKLWSDLKAEYIGKHEINNVMCHGWKQELFSDYILTYTDVATNLPVKEIHVTRSYNTSSTYLEFIPGIPSPSHFNVPSGCPPPPATSENVSSDARTAKLTELRQLELKAVEWHMSQAKPLIDKTALSQSSEKLWNSVSGPVELEQRTLQPFEYISYGPVPPNSLIYLQYNIRTQNGNNVDVFFVDGENYQKFRSGAAFSYLVFYSRVDVAIADFPAQTFRGAATEYFLVIHAASWDRPVVMDMQVNLRFQKSLSNVGRCECYGNTRQCPTLILNGCGPGLRPFCPTDVGATCSACQCIP